MLQIDKNTLKDFQERGVEKILVYFYEAGCSGMKVDIKIDFKIEDDMFCITPPSGGGCGNETEAGGVFIYVYKKDKNKFDGSRITRIVKADHTGEEKIRYIFANEKIKDRCGCGSSFNFEKKKPKLNIEKLKKLKNNFSVGK